MKRTLARRLLALAAVAGFAGGGASVHAAGTDAGTTISNTATVDFQVSSVAQPTVTSAPVEFVVDRLLDVDVTTQNSDGVAVAPGADGGDPATDAPASGSPAFLTFDVTNQGNTDADLLLAVVRNGAYPGSFTTAVPGGQTADASTLVGMCTSSDGSTCDADGVLSAEGTNSGTFRLPAVVEDATVTVLVFFDLPVGATNTQFDAWSLVAAVTDPDNGDGYLASDSSGNAGPGQTGTAVDDDPGVIQNVFGDETGADAYDFVADLAATGPSANDGQHAVTSAFRIAASELSITKASRVVRDPFTGDAFTYTAGGASGGGQSSGTFDGPSGTPGTAKAIPGAIVEYVITVENGDGSGASAATATNVTVSDSAPTNTSPGNTIDTGDDDLDRAIVRQCDGSTVTVLTFDATNDTISADLGSCADGQTGTVTYYVTVD